MYERYGDHFPECAPGYADPNGALQSTKVGVPSDPQKRKVLLTALKRFKQLQETTERPGIGASEKQLQETIAGRLKERKRREKAPTSDMPDPKKRRTTKGTRVPQKGKLPPGTKILIPGSYFSTPNHLYYHAVIKSWCPKRGYRVYFPPTSVNFPGVESPDPETWTCPSKSLEKVAIVVQDPMSYLM